MHSCVCVYHESSYVNIFKQNETLIWKVSTVFSSLAFKLSHVQHIHICNLNVFTPTVCGHPSSANIRQKVIDVRHRLRALLVLRNLNRLRQHQHQHTHTDIAEVETPSHHVLLVFVLLNLPGICYLNIDY